jgi:hypothetical protein
MAATPLSVRIERATPKVVLGAKKNLAPFLSSEFSLKKSFVPDISGSAERCLTHLGHTGWLKRLVDALFRTAERRHRPIDC